MHILSSKLHLMKNETSMTMLNLHSLSFCCFEIALLLLLLMILLYILTVQWSCI